MIIGQRWYLARDWRGLLVFRRRLGTDGFRRNGGVGDGWRGVDRSAALSLLLGPLLDLIIARSALHVAVLLLQRLSWR